MHEFIARLIRCGMPRTVAVAVCGYYRKHGTLDELRRYVEAVEEETNVPE